MSIGSLCIEVSSPGIETGSGMSIGFLYIKILNLALSFVILLVLSYSGSGFGLVFLLCLVRCGERRTTFIGTLYSVYYYHNESYYIKLLKASGLPIVMFS